MCGIFGYSQKHSKELNHIFFSSMKHRGPDSQNFTQIDHWNMAHLRLSIIDTSSAGNQPMSSGSSTIVFNGEIYNYLELKQKYLAQKSLKGESDTEVLLNLLDNHGVSILNKLNGMFAFAWYNVKNKKMYLCRDRYGVKPLYWTKFKNNIYYSSEIRPLAILSKKCNLSDQSIIDYLDKTTGDNTEETCIEGIFQVLPGHYVEIDNTYLHSKKWYNFSDFQFDKTVFKSKKDTFNFFENLLVDSIRLRFRSDVPVCLTLSGGLDSTVLYTLTKERISKNITCITFQNSDSSIDEVSIAKKLTEEYGDKLIVIKSKIKYSFSDYIESTKILEFPIWNPSAIAYLQIYSAIKKRGFKVVIEGHGSDEQLGGYPYLIEEIWKELLQKGKILDAFFAFKAYRKSLNKLLSHSPSLFLLPFILTKVIFRIQKNCYNGNKKIHESFDYSILPMVLRAFDRLTMSQSLESRSPYMDFRVVEFLRHMPVEYKVDRMGSKAPLRYILQRYQKEYIYINRSKIGFALDIQKLIADPVFRRNIKKCISNFNFPKFNQQKKVILENIDKPQISWQDAIPIFKFAALALTQKLYEGK